MSSDVRLIPLGVGEAFSAIHYTTCFLLGVDDAWVLIDCPHPVRKMLREASNASGLGLDLGDIQAVLLTHLHADHCSGMEDYLYFSHFALGRKATLIAAPDVSARVWPNVLAAGMDQAVIDLSGTLQPMTRDDYFDTIDLDESRPVTFGPFTIECRRTLHSVPTTAFRIKAGGRTIGFSADTAFDPSLIDWLAPADLIIHEATGLSVSPVHTPYAHLAALPEALRGKMHLFHYPDDFDAANSLIEPLQQGKIYRV